MSEWNQEGIEQASFKHIDAKEVDKEKPYSYEAECGMFGVTLIGGVKALEHKGETCHAVKDTDGLDLTMAYRLIEQDALLNGDEIRFFRKTLGYSQRQLAKLLGKTHTSVSNWEKKVSKQDKPSDFLIRLLYLHSVGDDDAILKRVAKLRASV